MRRQQNQKHNTTGHICVSENTKHSKKRDHKRKRTQICVRKKNVPENNIYKKKNNNKTGFLMIYHNYQSISKSEISLGFISEPPQLKPKGSCGLNKRKPWEATVCFNPSGHWVRGRQTTMHLESPINPQPSGLWEEAGVPGENPRGHKENMQTPHREPTSSPLRAPREAAFLQVVHL